MLYCPPKYITPCTNINDELMKLEGDLYGIEADASLAKFLRYNLGLTVDWVAGFKMTAYQEAALKAFFLRNFTLCVWGRGVAKSVDYKGLTFLLERDRGFILLKDLLPNINFSLGDRWQSIPELNLWNGNSWQKTDKIYVQSQKPCLSITTSNGYNLNGSTNHLIKIINTSTCKIEWKRYGELSIDDYICINRKEAYWENNTTINADDAYLIGLIIGDGCISTKNNYISITSADKEILDFCKLYGATIRDRKNTIAKNIIFNKEKSDSIFLFSQLKKGLSYDKIIPPIILGNRDLLKACIQGLFDTDGTAVKSRLAVSYTTTSECLAGQVHNSLLLFGITSSIYLNKTPSPFGKCWKIQVSGKDCIKFRDTIGFRLTRKQSILNNNIIRITTNTNKDIIPGLKKYIQKNIKSKYRFSKEMSDEWRNKIRRKDNQKNLSYSTLSKYINFLERAGVKEEDLLPLKEIQSQNFFFDKISKIDISTNNCIDFNIPDGEMYWSNGFISHNSTIASLACFFIPLFEPNTNIIIAGPTYRTARLIFSYMEKIEKSPEAVLLKQCLGAKSKRNDMLEWEINGGIIRAIPLNGEKIRGLRANVLVLDEFLLLSEDIIKNVLMPFLIAPSDIKKRIEIHEKEDREIELGLLKEGNRTVFKNSSRMICLSSASFTFENLYKVYTEWIDKIYSNKIEDAKYAVSQISYEAIPEYMWEKAVISEAKSGGEMHPAFKREYCAQFVDGSDSYFSAKKMHQLTITDGQEPTALLKGRPGKEYILSIDPNFSQSSNADHFAMAVLELDKDNEKAALVHNYAKAGVELRKHIEYFYYLLTNFNIVMITADNMDGNFIQSANESALFQQNNLKLDFIDYDGELQGEEQIQQLVAARRQYNLNGKKICFKHIFNQPSIRRINEQLQTWINTNRIHFASKLTQSPDYENILEKTVLPLELEESRSMGELIAKLISDQDDAMFLTKKECSLIEVRISPTGGQIFDLPLALKRNTSQNRARRDSYTALMLGVEGARVYFDIMRQAPKQATQLFVPQMFGRATL